MAGTGTGGFSGIDWAAEQEKERRRSSIRSAIAGKEFEVIQKNNEISKLEDILENQMKVKAQYEEQCEVLNANKNTKKDGSDNVRTVSKYIKFALSYSDSMDDLTVGDTASQYKSVESEVGDYIEDDIRSLQQKIEDLKDEVTRLQQEISDLQSELASI